MVGDGLPESPRFVYGEPELDFSAEAPNDDEPEDGDLNLDLKQEGSSLFRVGRLRY